ncbi:MAG TPA: protein kinase [Candidatus Sulfomarinibacteraceae bacterium]|nr:protein kinase [Candidatus Sulfomarinibacteraceae bacterium]
MERDATVTLNRRYKLIERSGSGGMATVYKAQDLMLRRLVAVKILHESFTGDEEFLRRFQREAHAAANLSHPNIVTVHDIGQDDHRHYIVMEYINGRTLKELIREKVGETGTPLSVARTLELGIQICAGIGYAHRAGLVHCDVKPQNVLVTRDDRVKVADFGIARAMSQASVQTASMLWGTPHYFAPEQAAGEQATPASDVYAIGIILFEMLSGRLPFEADTLPALALKHMHEPPPLLSSLNPSVPVQLEQIVNKVLSKEPAGRYRTAGQLQRILRSYQESSQEDTGPILPIQSPQPEEEPRPVSPPAAVVEQKTQVFERPVSRPIARATSQELPTRAVSRHSQQTPTSREWDGTQQYNRAATQEAGDTDWTAITLGFLALVAMLGLIPLWYLVARAWGVW